MSFLRLLLTKRSLHKTKRWGWGWRWRSKKSKSKLNSKSPKLKIPSLDNLGDELLTEILIRMPVDSVHCCKTISKRWLSLISSSAFAQRCALYRPDCRHSVIYHYSYMLDDESSMDPFGVFDVAVSEQTPWDDSDINSFDGVDVIESERTLPDYSGVDPFDVVDIIESEKALPLLRPSSFDFLPINPEEFESVRLEGLTVYLASSCNGLLLCSAKPEGRWQRTLYYICNPLTKKWVLLPPPPPLIVNEKFFALDVLDERAGFVCDNGFHGDNLRYKVILFPKPDEDGMKSTVKIFSFCCESGNWSDIDVELPQGYSWGQHSANIVSYNGVLYGLFSEGIFMYDPFNKPDELEVVDFPEDMNVARGKDACIGVTEGKIRICNLSIESIEFDVEFYIDMWEIEDFSKRKWWKPHHRFCLSETHQVYTCDLKWRDGTPQFVKSISDVNGDIIYIFNHSSVFWCNLKTKVLESLFHISCFHGGISNFVPIVLPWWPTPVPKMKPGAQLLSN